MLVVKNWLAEYLSKSLSDEAMAAALERAGVEVEAMRRLGDFDPKIVVAEVEAIKKHPNADRLSIVEIDLGDIKLKIVSGAPNLTKAMKVPFAPVGSRLPGGMVIAKAQIRGVESPGMLLSAQELGLSEDQTGLLALDAKLEPGQPLNQIFSQETVFDVKTAANRSDLQSYVGLAREVAAQSDIKLKAVEVEAIDLAGATKAKHFNNEIKSLVPRYALAKLVVKAKLPSSPDWLVRRLELSGIRPFNLIVDVTNYVMLEHGQPLHAFDEAKVSGGVVVRQAKTNEKLITLDGKTRNLSVHDIVIADSQKAIGLAGVIGGEGSAINAKTNNVLLEAATFDGAAIRKTAVRQSLRTDASARFERGLPTQVVGVGLNRALVLLEQLAKVEVEWVEDELNIWPWIQHIGVKAARISQLAGQKITEEEIVSKLRSLGFVAEKFDIVAETKKHLGKPYKWGANFKQDGVGAFDCSYLVDYVYSLIDVYVGHSALGQFEHGDPVATSELKPGDVLFLRGKDTDAANDHYFTRNGDGSFTKNKLAKSKFIIHDGIYVGGGKVIHANGGQYVDKNLGVVVAPLSRYSQNDSFVGAKRYVDHLEGWVAITVPFWRPDVKLAEDVFEEVIKLVGLDDIPSSLPPWQPKEVKPDRGWTNLWDIRASLIGLGLVESLHYPFVSSDQLKLLGYEPNAHLKVANPRSPEQSYLRQSLLPGLLASVKTNTLVKTEFGLFEIGRVFVPANGQELPSEPTKLSVIVQAEREPYLAVKNVIDNLAIRFNLDLEFQPADSYRFMLTGRVAEIETDKLSLGYLGQLHPQVTKALKIRHPAAYLEIDLTKFNQNTSQPNFKPIGRYQVIERDLTIVLDEAINWQTVMAGIGQPEDLKITYGGDYFGTDLGTSKRALTLHIEIQPTGPHYSDQQISDRLNALVKLLRTSFQAELR